MLIPDLQALVQIVSGKKLEQLTSTDFSQLKAKVERLPRYMSALEELWLQQRCVTEDKAFATRCCQSREWYVATSSCDLTPDSFPLYQPSQHGTLFAALKSGVTVNILVAANQQAQTAVSVLFDLVNNSGVAGNLTAYHVPHEKVSTIGDFNPNLWAAFELLVLDHSNTRQSGGAAEMYIFHEAATHTYDESLEEQRSGSAWIRVQRAMTTEMLSALSTLRRGLQKLSVYDELKLKPATRKLK